MNETTFQISAWYALKADTAVRGPALSVLRRTVRLAINGNAEDQRVFPRADLVAVQGPIADMANVFSVRSKP